jgi:hypothetical protein
MTVNELLLKLGAAFALFRSAGEAWAPVFRARLGRHEGAALQQAFLDTLATFRPGPRQAFPLPADFEQNLPACRLALPRDGCGAQLDFAGRDRRARGLMAEWRRAQGEAAAQGVPELAIALADLAWPLARRAAWTAEPPPLRLSRQQVRLAGQRALSQQRRREQPALPRDGDAWWAAIEAIARRWRIDTAREEWCGPSHGHRGEP